MRPPVSLLYALPGGLTSRCSLCWRQRLFGKCSYSVLFILQSHEVLRGVLPALHFAVDHTRVLALSVDVVDLKQRKHLTASCGVHTGTSVTNPALVRVGYRMWSTYIGNICKKPCSPAVDTVYAV